MDKQREWHPDFKRLFELKDREKQLKREIEMMKPEIRRLQRRIRVEMKARGA